MKDARDMSAEEFDRARSEEFDYVRRQIAAIRKQPATKRAKLTVHEIFCRGRCNAPVVQVLEVRLSDGSPAKAVCYRRMKPSNQELPHDAGPQHLARAMRDRKRSLQLV
ncbi:hypothetical protein [Mycobacterium sp. PSTR-4-N]|uniref:hypothetical protein n=1 Tax=Mycobacterium sp. PSTR-4-N TaxID=2917745 RepID=UPI001F155DFD|nr:hypothetical protein [Mycobacterium sp. PSTR-4-N]MCG7597843.1 hypothetical protein [Mycobacterium sp. PSTR-4-N]